MTEPPDDKKKRLESGPGNLRQTLFDIIFGWQTPAGKWFDLILLVAIVASVVVVCLKTVVPREYQKANNSAIVGANDDAQESDVSVDPATEKSAKTSPAKENWTKKKWTKEEWQAWGAKLELAEWIFTILFTIEYLVRLYCLRRPLRYAFSAFGIIDLLAFLPTYLMLIPFISSTSSFSVLRALRLLRVFRILNLVWLMREAEELGRAVVQAQAKIVVFLGVVLIAVTIAGTLVYEIEHGYLDSNFQNIPDSIYWAIVTMTTVGYGDIVPITPAGKFVSAILILLGYSLIIVPTGFVSAELMESKMVHQNLICPNCGTRGHEFNASFCKSCGNSITKEPSS